jgi:hypothetical protein
MKEVPLNIFMDSFYETDFSDLKMPAIMVYKNPLDFPDKYVARLSDLLSEIPCGFNITEIAKNNPEWESRSQICEKCNVKHLGPIQAMTNHVVVKETLEEIRDAIPERFFMFPRFKNDTPYIVEVWI